MNDIIGTICLLILFMAGMAVGFTVVYGRLGLIGVVIASALLIATVLLYYNDKI